MEPFRELPNDVPEEKLSELVNELGDQTRKIGLYLQGAGLHSETPPGEEEPVSGPYKLVSGFTIGDIAFSKRVQDPEQEKVDEEFTKIKLDDVEDTIKGLRERYEGKKLGEDGTQAAEED